jgi:hypothetical protein
MPSPAAIGFRAHSGWAAAVAVVRAGAGPADPPVAIMRRRIEMADRGSAGPSQPYHAAVGLNIREAEQHVANCAARAAALAAAGLRGMIDDLKRLGHRTAGCGLLSASGRPLPPLEKILASHPLLHTAEGELFRDALRAASRECGVPLITVKERELHTQAIAGLRLRAGELETHVAAMGKGIGPPWRQDQKFAAVVAWLALRRG